MKRLTAFLAAALLALSLASSVLAQQPPCPAGPPCDPGPPPSCPGGPPCNYSFGHMN